jgi:hypothetical protein
MLRCKHVAKALADSYYKDLPWYRRIGLKSHVALCVFCGKYHRNVLTLQDAVQTYLRHEESNEKHRDSLCMSEEANARIRQKLEESAKH